MKRMQTANWRLILSGYQDAYTNMALDEALLEGYLRCTQIPTLRIYGWKPSAISFGYFQDPQSNVRIDACVSRGISLVRRLTGGGALIHDGDLSYSVICSSADLGCETSVIESFQKTCSFLKYAYAAFGLDAHFACEDNQAWRRRRLSSVTQPDFCLAAHEKYDIVVGGRKLGGNAQKRRKRALLQHGSIPLRDISAQAAALVTQGGSSFDSGFASLSDLAGRDIRFEALQQVLIDAFCQSFGVTLVQGALGEEEERIFRQLRDTQYATKEWNYALSGSHPQACVA